MADEAPPWAPRGQTPAEPVHDDEPDPDEGDGSADPGPLPDELLRVPGFVSELMDYTMATAPYPNAVLAFAGALAAQSFLAGRKVRDPGDIRPNVYLLGLAHSGVGKQHPRDVNTRLLVEIGLAAALGDGIASGEGLEDALHARGAMLFQTDEVDGMLQSMKRDRDARHESLGKRLLTIYSASASVYLMRVKAGERERGTINQPHLTLFGTAIPSHFYDAISERMLTNGLFARMIVVQAGDRGRGRTPDEQPLPERILGAARHWSERASPGNLGDINPIPAIVPITADARNELAACQGRWDDLWDQAKRENDDARCAVLARAFEHVRKLALLHACSENYQEPRISMTGVRWAQRVIDHLTKRMLFMAATRVSDDPEFQRQCERVREIIRRWTASTGKSFCPTWYIAKRSRWPNKLLTEVLETMVNQRSLKVTENGSRHGGTIYAIRK